MGKYNMYWRSTNGHRQKKIFCSFVLLLDLCSVAYHKKKIILLPTSFMLPFATKLLGFTHPRYIQKSYYYCLLFNSFLGSTLVNVLQPRSFTFFYQKILVFRYSKPGIVQSIFSLAH